MLTTVIAVQQGICDKYCGRFADRYQPSWMPPEPTPPPRYEVMAHENEEWKRPEMHRERSNSVPVAVSLMDCTAVEAGLIFSAAEKASARRRKTQSVDDSNTPPSIMEPNSQQVITPVYEDAGESEDSFSARTTPSQDEPRTPTMLGSQDSTPMVSPGIKTYNDDMVKFVKQRLQDMAFTYCEPPQPKAQPQEPDQKSINTTASPRPPLVSHFSNWSIADSSEDGDDAIDLAGSPAAAEESVNDDLTEEHIGPGYAQVVQLRHQEAIERSASPSYFSWPAKRASKPVQKPIAFDTPVTAELRPVPPKKQPSTPLIDLDASQPEVSRSSRGLDFFDFGFKSDRQPTPSTPSSFQLRASPLHIEQHIVSPQFVRC